MRTSRVISVLLVLATAAVLLWPSRETISGKTMVTFTVWGMPFEDRLFLDRYAKRWEELNPAVRVDYRRYGDDLLMKYNAWHTRGRGPEVMRLRITDYHGMAARGLLARLDPFMGAERESILADIPRQLRPLLEAEGPEGRGIYALPEDNAQYGLFFNRTLFDEYNAAHPDDRVGYPSPDWTWEDLRRAAKRLTRYDGPDPRGRIVQAGLDFTVWSWPFMTFFAQAGGTIWADDGLTCTLNTSAGVEALEFFRALEREDRSFQPSLSGYLSGTGPDVLFAAGRTAMFLDGSWRIPNIEKVASGLDFAVAPLPRGRVPAVVSGSVLWGVSAHARHKDNGWRMLRWLIEPAQAVEYWDTLRVAPPASLAALASPAFRSTHGVENPRGGFEVPPMPAERFEGRAAWMLYANMPHPLTGRPPGFVPVGPYQTELEEEVQRMLNEYLNPASTLGAQAALDGVVEHIHRIIDRDRAAKGLASVKRK